MSISQLFDSQSPLMNLASGQLGEGLVTGLEGLLDGNGQTGAADPCADGCSVQAPPQQQAHHHSGHHHHGGREMHSHE